MINKEMLNVALETITSACEQYVSDLIDENSLREVLANIPGELWGDAGASLSIITILVENEGMYDISLKKNRSFAEFICSFLPTVFWNNRDGILNFTKFIVDNMISWCFFATISDFKDIIQFVSDEVRGDRSFILSVVEMIAERANSLEWNGDFEDIVLESFLNDKDDLLAVVMFIMGANQSNAADFGLVPAAAWEYSEIIFWILSNFQDEYESDRYLCTMYPVFRGSKRDYLESFIQFIPEKFKTDKGFVIGLLDYTYFSDEFDVIYNWIDQRLWSDKEVVLKMLESDVTAIVYVPQELSVDEEIKKYIDENIDFEWDLTGVPAERIPGWIKEYCTEHP